MVGSGGNGWAAACAGPTDESSRVSGFRQVDGSLSVGSAGCSGFGGRFLSGGCRMDRLAVVPVDAIAAGLFGGVKRRIGPLDHGGRILAVEQLGDSHADGYRHCFEPNWKQ